MRSSPLIPIAKNKVSLRLIVDKSGFYLKIELYLVSIDYLSRVESRVVANIAIKDPTNIIEINPPVRV